MTFIFNTAIPAAANDPSFDQPDMLTNNQSTDGILAVDHISFNTANGGTHLQMHLPQYTNPSVINGTATQGSVAYSKAGTADAAHAQLFFKNPNGDFLLSGIRAFGYVDSAGNIIGSQSKNVSSVTRTSTGRFSIVLTANAVTSNQFLVLLSSTMTLSGSTIVGSSMGYNITGVGTFQLNFARIDGAAFQNPTSFTFIVIQI